MTDTPLTCFLGSHKAETFKFKAYDQNGDVVVAEGCSECAGSVYPEQKVSP